MSAQGEQRLREALAANLRGAGFWATHADRWNDADWQAELWDTLATSVLPVVLADREKAVQRARAEVVERVEAAIAAEDGWQVPGQPEYVSAEAVRAALREAQP